MSTTLQELIDSSNYIVFFGGAGVSTESNIPDFRSEDGLYRQKFKYPPEVMLSHSFYERHTEEFFDFYRQKMLFPDAKPNKAHIKLAEMEKAGKLKAVITQNIDGLHQAAGSKSVFELHGSVHRNYCQRCGKGFDLDYMLHSDGIPKCGCGGTIKPDVVLYEEGLDSNTMSMAMTHIMNSDLLIVGGTSLTVYPAAGMINYRGGKIVLINKTPTAADDFADLVITEPIGQALDRINI